MKNKILSNIELEDDLNIRPSSFTNYLGQEEIKENLITMIKAAKIRNCGLDHILLHGAPGLGKTTLASIIAEEMNASIKITSGAVIEKIGDLIGILSNLGDGDILFIDEIHRILKNIEEILYTAMEDHAVDSIVGRSQVAKSIRLDLPLFTLI